MKKIIVLTGGGSAGHVVTHLAMIPLFKKEGWTIVYIGSKAGIEREMISKIEGIRYYPISTGKLRRYFSKENFIDAFRLMIGLIQSIFLIRKIKPNIIFSKGGFVSFPVVIGAKINRVPIIMHESDLTLGLANKLSLPFVSKLFTTFEESLQYIQSPKAEYLGPVIREEIKKGDKNKGLELCEFSAKKPIILVMGGSLGAKSINEALRNNLEELLDSFQMVHICGKGNRDIHLINKKDYKQFEFVDSTTIAHLMAMSDFVISRAGSNSIFEFLYLKKPMILIPLPKKVSRGDQVLNAAIFEKKGYCKVIEEKDLNQKNSLAADIFNFWKNIMLYKDRMNTNIDIDSSQILFDRLKNMAK